MADQQQEARLSRFNSPSSLLDLGAVGARQTRKIRIVSLAVAIALHGSLAIWKVSMERKAVKPLTTRFIKREPRLVKPLELRKAPKPKRREMRRRMKQVRAKVDTRGISRAPKTSRVLEGMVRPVTTMSQAATFERPALEPMVESEKVAAAKAAGKRLDLALEMVDVTAFDFGQHKGMVIQDPTDKRRIKGFLKIGSVYLAASELMISTTRMHSKTFSATQFSNNSGTVLSHLANAVNQYTDIRVQVVEEIAASDGRLLDIPWLTVGAPGTGDILPVEARNLGKYLTIGGFIWTEGGATTEPMCRAMFEQSLETQGLSRGQHWEFEILPNDHPMYHSFFDFDGPPAGGDAWLGAPGRENSAYRGLINRRDYIEGIELNGRLVAIYDTKGYLGRTRPAFFIGSGWGSGFKKHDSSRDAQYFAINIIVFALTQEGSLARQAVASGY